MQSIAALNQQQIVAERAQALTDAAKRLVEGLLGSSQHSYRSTRQSRPLTAFRWRSVTDNGTVKFVVISKSESANTEVRVFDNESAAA